MPTINAFINDLNKLIGKNLSVQQLQDLLSIAKSELKDFDSLTGELKIEINDTNRPDLWSVEGLARQLAIFLDTKKFQYPFFVNKEPYSNIEVDSELLNIRPYIGAFIAIGLKIDEPTLIQLIQTQEKLAENYGRKRSSVAIGIYPADKIHFPIRYIASPPSQYSFVPLGMDTKLTLDQILKEHPKGIEYGKLIQHFNKYPLIIDSKNQVLSMPPVINSRFTGEVKIDDDFLFVEATGTDYSAIILCLNIMAANLYDRGAEIFPIKISYPYDTPFSKNVIVPMKLNNSITVKLEDVEKLLGEKLSPSDFINYLQKYGCKVTQIDINFFEVEPLPVRNDYMHWVDVAEDLAISFGYNQFELKMPPDFTVGKLADITLFEDTVREYMIGFGFEEIISNILTNKDELAKKMELNDTNIVSIDNVMTETYSVVRNQILPLLLRVEGYSSTALYPHKIFEVGEVAFIDPEDNYTGTRTEYHLSALIAHPKANFSEMQGYLFLLMYYLDFDFHLEQKDLNGFIEGRSGIILVDKTQVGYIGELHPKILENWEIKMPCSVMELNLSNLLKIKNNKMKEA